MTEHYLTRVDLNPRRRGTPRLLSSPHRIHGAVAACFPPSEFPSRPLWRVDQLTEATVLYILSDTPPDPTSVVEEYGWPLAQGWRTKDYRGVLDAVQHGRRFAFRLTANPVHNIRLPSKDGDGEGGRTRRVAHVTATQQLAWLLSHTERWGFDAGDIEFPAVRVVDRRTVRFDRRGHPVTLGVATFEGVLAVTDAAVLRERLVEGIGHAKAYGCGLLTLAPAP